MKLHGIKILCALMPFLLCTLTWAYRIDPGEFYVSGGLGANISVVRNTMSSKYTPKAFLPMTMGLDYAIDERIGLFMNLVPQFASDHLGFSFHGGAKYWLSFFESPFVPYVSLAFSPSILIPTNHNPSHINLGLSPGIGMSYFILAKLMVGTHIYFNPSLALVDGERNFEFSVMSFFDVSLRV